MKLIKELLTMRANQLNEGRGPLMGPIENWMDATKTYNFEGQRGIQNLEKLVRVLGYSSLTAFLSDNSGAIEAVINWVGTQRNSEWVEAFAPYADEEDEE